MSWVMKKRIHDIELFLKYPVEVQSEVFSNLVKTAKKTDFGRQHGFADVKTINSFKDHVPIHTYEQIYPYIDKLLNGKQNVLWPSDIKWFAKSSGTTNAKSKFIPVSPEALSDCHFKGGKDMLSIYFNNYPESRMFTGKGLAIGGSQQINQYEFIPMESMGDDQPETVGLDEVELNKNYALVISTNSGLWRYLIGDTVKFTSLDPYRIRISGRTKHFINAFGEELIVENADLAIRKACDSTSAIIGDYTAGPRYLDAGKKGGHEWIIEFQEDPDDKAVFRQVLDETLQELNSDYEAKRHRNIALEAPVVHFAKPGTFYSIPIPTATTAMYLLSSCQICPFGLSWPGHQSSKLPS
jgi:hypothetical protein